MEADLNFVCPCGAFVEQTVPVPEPNLIAERHSDSTAEYWETIICDGCTKDFDVHVVNTFYDVDISVAGAIDLSFDVRHTPDDDEINWVIESTEQLESFSKVMRDVVILSRLDTPDDAKNTLYNMLHSQVVTAIEAYLSGMFIHIVINSEELIRKLIESNPELAKQRFSLKEIFTKWNELKIIVAKYLKDLIFHDLKTVKPMYKSVLDIEFGDIEWLFKAVLTRHDCVHRNGTDKDGLPANITKESIMKLIRKSTGFIGSIEEQINNRSIEP